MLKFVALDRIRVGGNKKREGARSGGESEEKKLDSLCAGKLIKTREQLRHKLGAESPDRSRR